MQANDPFLGDGDKGTFHHAKASAPITRFSAHGKGLLGDMAPRGGSRRQGCEQEVGVHGQSRGSAGSKPAEQVQF